MRERERERERERDLMMASRGDGHQELADYQKGDSMLVLQFRDFVIRATAREMFGNTEL